MKIIVDPSKALATEGSFSDEATRQKMSGLHGVLTLCDRNGFPEGFINAEELTGYRTSMSAMILYVRRQRTANIVVFGAGKQALWHLRLALALRGSEIKRVTVVNRSVGRTKALLETIRKENEEGWKADVDFGSMEPGDEAAVESVLGQADVVFCTTPSREVLFPARYLTSQGAGCYVSAIGSWSPDMIELDPDLVSAVVGMSATDGMVVVDNRDECMHSAGEIVRSGLEENKVNEIGEILESLTKAENERQENTKQCLESGYVVYKSVGVSMTDLAAGQAVLQMARKRGQGITIPEF